MTLHVDDFIYAGSQKFEDLIDATLLKDFKIGLNEVYIADKSTYKQNHISISKRVYKRVEANPTVNKKEESKDTCTCS